MTAIPAIDLGRAAPAAVGYASLGGQTVDAKGNVTYNFAGHVHATGLDIDAGASGSPPNDSRVRWLRVPDGAVVGEQYAYDTGGGASGMTLTARDQASGGLASLFLSATATSRVSIVAGGFSVGLLDNDLRSNFLFSSGGKSYTGTVFVGWPGGVTGIVVTLTPSVGFVPVGFVALADQTNVGDNHCYAFGNAVVIQTTGFAPPAGTVSKLYVIAWGA